MRKSNALKSALAAAFAISAATLATAGSAKAEEVYFIRGAFNVFSQGMNQMVSQLRARGVNAKGLSNGQWSGIANDIIKRHKQGRVSFPIVVAGHSVGGQEAPRFSDKLWQAGIPVALVIGVDPGFAPPPKFSAGAPRVVNFWIPGSARGNPYKAAGAFQGSIRNVSIRDFGSTVDHVGIDKDPVVQRQIVAEVMATVARKPAAEEAAATSE